jgi:hypothetical protein
MYTIEKIHSAEQRRIFTIDEARDLLPLVYHITEEAHKIVKKMIHRLEALQGSDLVLAAEIEAKINFEVTRWQNKVVRLGAVPKGMWLADFDCGNGFYCWKFPENNIRFFHGYQEGFSGRIELTVET